MTPHEFLQPRLDGDRFSRHTLPLDVLKDFAALQEMLVEVAKWEFRRAHPERKRVPRNFDQGLELHLSNIGEGSALATVVFFFSGMFPEENMRHLEQARDDIVESIAAVDVGGTPPLPPYLLGYFDSLGRSLREGESMSFQRSDGGEARLTPQTRLKLVRAAQATSWTEEVRLHGRIPEVDQQRHTFTMQLRDGSRLNAPLPEPLRSTVIEAFNQYLGGAHVLLKAVGRKEGAGQLKALESVEHISLLDPLDIGLRMDELAELQEGWLDGRGVAPPADGLRWLGNAMQDSYSSELRLPYLYPTPEGGIRAEWTAPDWEISLDIDLSNRTGSYQALRLSTDALDELELDLNREDGWRALHDRLLATGGVRA